MASEQETLRAALGADPVLTALVGDRIYPGQVPADETPTPWLFYAFPESNPFDELGDDNTVVGQVEFHALADTYALAKSITDALISVIDKFQGGQITLCLWDGTSEESTEYGYHHVARFKVWSARALTIPATGPRARVLTADDHVRLQAGNHELSLGADGLLLDGSTLGLQGPAGPQGPAGAAGANGATGPAGPNTLGGSTTTAFTGLIYGTGSVCAGASFSAVSTSGPLLTLTAQAATDTPLKIVGAASQSASLQDWRDNSGNAGARVTAAREFSNPLADSTSEQFGAGAVVTSGKDNCVALGHGALARERFSVAIGANAVAGNTGSALQCIAIGPAATTGIYTNATVIGSNSACGGDSAVVIGQGITTADRGIAIGSGLTLPSLKPGGVMGLNAVQKTAGDLTWFWDQGFGSNSGFTIEGSSSTGTVREVFRVGTSWVVSTDASRTTRSVFYAYDTAAREAMRIEASGSAAMIGFLGAAAITRPTVTGSRGGNAALASLLTTLATLGLITDSTTA